MMKAETARRGGAMALTMGTGPFGDRPGGRFNFDPNAPEGVLSLEDVPYRIRALFARATVVDSRRVKLLHESGHLPVYYFPEADVDADLLEPSGRTTVCPRKGTAT